MNLFDSSDQNPLNQCFCPRPDVPCGIQGVFDASSCKSGAPVAISWPHFLHGNRKLLTDVEGLKPNEKIHGYYIDIEPVSIKGFKEMKLLF